MALIANRQTKISSEVHPAAAYVILWAGIIWMSMVEGGQASMVGLPPVNPELYKESHKTTYYITSVGHKGDNLDRYVSWLRATDRCLLLLAVRFSFRCDDAGSPFDHSVHRWVNPRCCPSLDLTSLSDVDILTFLSRSNFVRD